MILRVVAVSASQTPDPAPLRGARDECPGPATGGWSLRPPHPARFASVNEPSRAAVHPPPGASRRSVLEDRSPLLVLVYLMPGELERSFVPGAGSCRFCDLQSAICNPFTPPRREARASAPCGCPAA